MQQSNRLVFGIVAFCFFVSGMAGLAYQLAWMRYLALFLGHTSYAVVAVLVAFMGGLAIGNAVFGIWADKAAKPLAFYAWLEFGIGIYGLLFPAYYVFCHDAYIGLARSWQPEGGGALFLKFLFSLASILLPTVLMGATLPVLTRFITRSLAELRENVAALYAVNSAGAVAGCVVADFWWIPGFGLDFTVFAAAALNFVAGLLAFWLSVRTGERASSSEISVANQSPGETFTASELRLAIIGIGVSGFVAMLYEVTWTRLLALALGSSTHAFSLMLITFIAGIAAGACVIYRWKGIQNSLRAFAWAELALAGSVLVSMFFYEDLPFWFLKLGTLLARQSAAYPLYELIQGLMCFAVMFIPTLCLGLTLPLVSRIATGEVKRTGRSVGKVFAVNTLGTVLGVVVTGLWLMPTFGLAQTFAVGVALNALIGVAILKRDRLNWRRRVFGTAGAALFVVGAGAVFSDNWQATFSLGYWRQGEFSMTRAEFKEAARSKYLKYVRDGAGSTVAVTSWREGEKENLALSVNGKVDASTLGDVPTQLLVGHIPMLLHPNPNTTLIVGLGSGMTAAAVATHPIAQRIDVVEISPHIVEAARLFVKHNDNVHENPRVRILLEDAKSFLKTTDQRYDVIISEPSNPWMAGIAGVFSQEYYESCRERLSTNGLVTQWVQTYETDDATLELIVRTFTSVFPFISVWQPVPADLVLIGSVQPFAPNLDRVLERLTNPAVQANLRRVEMDPPAVLLARELVSWNHGGFMVPPDGPIHSDYFPVLEYRAQEAFFIKRSASLWKAFDENWRTTPTTLLGTYLKEHSFTEEDFKTIALFYLEHGVPDARIIASMLHRWQTDFPQAILPLEVSMKLLDLGDPSELAVQEFRPLRDTLLDQATADPAPLHLYAHYLLRAYRSQRSVFFQPPTDELKLVLERLLEANPANARVYQLYRAELAGDTGDVNKCLELGLAALGESERPFAELLRADPSAPIPVLIRMMEHLEIEQRLDEALEISRFAIANGYAEQDPVLAARCRRISTAILQR